MKNLLIETLEFSALIVIAYLLVRCGWLLLDISTYRWRIDRRRKKLYAERDRGEDPFFWMDCAPHSDGPNRRFFIHDNFHYNPNEQLLEEYSRGDTFLLGAIVRRHSFQTKEAATRFILGR